MSIKLTFEIQLQSDYHVSAGQRGGLTVDSALLRDYDSAPVFRGTMVAGLLRDGLADLKHLAETQSIPLYQEWDEASERLFGSAENMKRWAFSSARPSQILQKPNSKAEEQWGANDVARVRINPRTRRSAPQQLFFEEEGDARIKFRFTAVCEADGLQDQQDAYLLVAAARMVRHLGAARRRGRGQCQLQLVAANGIPLGSDELTKEALSQFKTSWLTLSDPVQASSSVQAVNAQALTLTGEMKRFRIVAQLREPLVVARRSEAANAYETLPVVPGTAVLGALATRAARKLNLRKSKVTPTEFVQLFLRDAVQTSHLTLAAFNEEELSPTITAPRAFFQCENYAAFQTGKGGVRHTLHNGLTGKPPAQCSVPGCGGKVKAVTGFVQVNHAQLLFTPQKREEMHIKMERDTGRAQEGDLYEYIALEAGQWLTGELQCDAGVWPRLKALTGLVPDKKLEIRLGKASRRGYGLLDFVLVEIEADEAATPVLLPLKTRLANTKIEASPTDLTVSLLLLSDTVLLDTWGRYYTGFDEAWLQNALSGVAQSVTVDEQYCSSRLVDSFNGHRRLPRWRDEAIESGSVAQITIKTDDMSALLARLKELELKGIGWRTAEGFGQVAFNHPLLQSPIPKIDSMDISEVNEILNPLSALKTDVLQKEATFRQEWRQKLSETMWDSIDKSDYDALARLLFVYRYQNIDELLRWLEWGEGRPQHLENSANLWGKDKQIATGDKESRLSKEGLTFVAELVEQLQPKSAAQQAIGLDLLANYLSDVAAKIKGGEA